MLFASERELYELEWHVEEGAEPDQKELMALLFRACHTVEPVRLPHLDYEWLVTRCETTEEPSRGRAWFQARGILARVA